jgi:hypothetical protein
LKKTSERIQKYNTQHEITQKEQDKINRNKQYEHKDKYEINVQSEKMKA